MIFSKLFLFLFLLNSPKVAKPKSYKRCLFPVSIIHMNDFHARFEATNNRSSPCKPQEGQTCIGGYGRVVTVVKKLMKIRRKENPIYLNAGDNFQGTFWYNLLKWNVTSHFLNRLKADAITLGNHEFDDGVEGVVPFLKTIQSPVVIANVDASHEISFQGKFTKSIIIDRYSRKIGVIGVVISTIHQIARIGKLKFFNESESIRTEAAKLKKQGVNIIIVLSHCGLDVDYEIATNAGPDIDVIVGGHSNTFMFTGRYPPGPDKPLDRYPATVTQANGHKVLIVQASAYTKYIGDLRVYFDAKGEVVMWKGNPIYLDSNIVEDPQIMLEMKPWKDLVDKEGLRKLGNSAVLLSKANCDFEECNIGNFITDSYVHYYKTLAETDTWTYASIGLANVGGIRASLNSGSLTYGDLISVTPFGNTIDCFEINGDKLLQALEYSVQKMDSVKGVFINMLQVTGLRIVYNITNPVGQRVVSVDALCNACKIPEYFPLVKNRTYRVIANSFMTSGGDGYDVLATNKANIMVGPIDINILVDYVTAASPISTGKDGRITILK